MAKEYVLTTEDGDRWRQALPAEACVMGSLEYTRIVEQESGYSGRLFVVDTGESAIAYPFFVRPVLSLPFASVCSGSAWDTFTAEYSGPIRIGDGEALDMDETGFSQRFSCYCRESGIIAEFAHLNPWHFCQPLLDPACVLPNREIVQVDLSLGEEALWTRSLTSDARRMTRKAEQSGVQVRRAETLADVQDFYRLHSATMERRQALDRYRLPLEYFAAIFKTMPDNSFIVLAEYQDQVIAGGIYFHDRFDVYWHLSAADMEFASARPVNKYVWETMLWATKAGKRRMLMGGGYQENDGVFRFKAGFSPLRAQFRTYRRIHDEARYEAVAKAWSAYYGVPLSKAQFFPAYRSPHFQKESTCEAASN